MRAPCRSSDDRWDGTRSWRKHMRARHGAGDALLSQFAQRLSERVRAFGIPHTGRRSFSEPKRLPSKHRGSASLLCIAYGVGGQPVSLRSVAR